jgi:hypothetical protein
LEPYGENCLARGRSLTVWLCNQIVEGDAASGLGEVHPVDDHRHTRWSRPCRTDETRERGHSAGAHILRNTAGHRVLLTVSPTGSAATSVSFIAISTCGRLRPPGHDSTSQ